MKKYIKLFDSHSDYETFKLSASFIMPNVSYCEEEEEVHYNPLPHDYSKDYLTFTALENTTFTFSKNIVNYSLDKGNTWVELAANTPSPTVTKGSSIIWKAEITLPSTIVVGDEGIGTFDATNNFEVKGNLMSLLFGDNYEEQIDLTNKDGVFAYLFKNNTKLISAENLILPATTLVSKCYYSMFNGCSNLIIAPILLAKSMKKECYRSMFSGCTSLVTAPELSATSLAQNCYQAMFSGCTSLTTAPELPAKSLAENCYYSMFNGCTSLTTAPELPAQLIVNGCYNSMFKDCSNLNYIKALFIITPGSSYTSNWVSGVAATGIFVKSRSASWNVTGVNGIPTGWTVQTASA